MLKTFLKYTPMIFMIIALSLLTGCESVEKSSQITTPAELEPIDSDIILSTQWYVDAGIGKAKQSINLLPAVTADYVYTADQNGIIRAINRNNGQYLWLTETNLNISGALAAYKTSLYLGSMEGDLLAIDNSNGKIKWRKTLSSEILAIPVAADNVLVVRSIDGKVYAFNTESGEPLWQYQSKTPLLTLRGEGRPVIHGDKVICGFANGKIIALNLVNGSTLWQALIAAPKGRSEIDRLIDIDVTPIIDNDIIYVAAFQGDIVAIEAETGTILWKRKLSTYTGLFANQGQLYLSDHLSRLWAMDTNNGASVWKQDKFLHRAITTPLFINGYLVVGDFEGYLHLIAAESGKIISRTFIDKEGVSTPPIIKDNTIYVYGDSGMMKAIQITSKSAFDKKIEAMW